METFFFNEFLNQPFKLSASLSIERLREILILVGITFFFIYLWQKNRRKQCDFATTIPGPKPVPFFGNFFQVNKNAPHLTFMEWQKCYGNVFKVSDK